MGLMQGVQLYMAHEAWPLADSPWNNLHLQNVGEDYMKRRARSLDVESNLSELRALSLAQSALGFLESCSNVPRYLP